MVSLSVNGNIFVMLIIRRILGPPESAAGRVLFSNPLLVSYYHSSLPQVGYGSVSCQPLQAHTVHRGHGGRYRRHPVGMAPSPGAWVFPVVAEGSGFPSLRAL